MTKVAVVNDKAVGIISVDREDVVLPHLLLMQPMSDMVTGEGKQIGTFVNSLTKESFPEALFTPVVYSKFFNIYRLNGKKTEYDCRVFNKNDERLKGKRFYPEGDLPAEVEAVMSYICLINLQPVVIQFSKSSTSGGKKLATLASLSRNSLWANSYKLKSIKVSNDRGTYFIKDVEPSGPTTTDAMAMADDLYSAYGDRAGKVTDASEAEVPF